MTSFWLSPGWWFIQPAAQVSGALQLSGGSTAATCRDVTVSIGGTSMTQTVRASRFLHLFGRCWYGSTRGGFIRAMVIDSKSGKWSLTGRAQRDDLLTIGSSTTIRIRVGAIEGTSTVPLTRARDGSVHLTAQ